MPKDVYGQLDEQVLLLVLYSSVRLGLSPTHKVGARVFERPLISIFTNWN